MSIHTVIRIFIAFILFLPTLTIAQDDSAPPDIPSVEEIEISKLEETLEEQEAEIEKLEDLQAGRYPTNYSFAIGLIGEYTESQITPTGKIEVDKYPLILMNPNNAYEMAVYAKNFPARIIANSPNGEWLVGVAPSVAVERSSGSRKRETAVGINLSENRFEIIEEFALFSDFDAYFSPNDDNLLFYSVNEPGVVNNIQAYNLKSKERSTVRAEGNRFYLHGLYQEDPLGIWFDDPFSVARHPVTKLIELNTGNELDRVEFPDADYVVTSPSGAELLVVSQDEAEATIGYYSYENKEYKQIPNLVLVDPEIRWLSDSKTIIVKEDTATRDRFIRVDLESNDVEELWTGYTRVEYWDVSPHDDALVFNLAGGDYLILYILPLTDENETTTRITLGDISRLRWLGCIYPPDSPESWLEEIIPF
jgi:hypothetical protein